MFNLTWLIPVFPLLAFALIVLFTNPNKRLSTGIAIGGIAPVLDRLLGRLLVRR